MNNQTQTRKQVTSGDPYKELLKLEHNRLDGEAVSQEGEMLCRKLIVSHEYFAVQKPINQIAQDNDLSVYLVRKTIDEIRSEVMAKYLEWAKDFIEIGFHELEHNKTRFYKAWERTVANADAEEIIEKGTPGPMKNGKRTINVEKVTRRKFRKEYSTRPLDGMVKCIMSQAKLLGLLDIIHKDQTGSAAIEQPPLSDIERMTPEQKAKELADIFKRQVLNFNARQAEQARQKERARQAEQLALETNSHEAAGALPLENMTLENPTLENPTLENASSQNALSENALSQNAPTGADGIPGVIEKDGDSGRSNDATERLAREGVWLGGIVPYGYTTVGTKKDCRLVPNDDPIPNLGMSEVEVVRLIFDKVGNEGLSCRVLADWLNATGIPTHYVRDNRKSRNKRKTNISGIWRPSRVRNLLVNPTYKGIHIWGLRNDKKRKRSGSRLNDRFPRLFSPTYGGERKRRSKRTA